MVITLGGLESQPLEVKTGLNSADVAQAIGTAASYCRFAADLPVPDDLSLATLAASKLTFQTFTEEQIHIDPLVPELAHVKDASRPLSQMRIGIGITTYNRRDILVETIEKIRSLSRLPVEILICDDGSSDGTVEYLEQARGISYIAASNRGIAWNKNRALFQLSQIRGCDVVILIEDDVQPTRAGWDVEWVLSALAYNHINYAPLWLKGNKGLKRWHSPLESGLVSGQCSAFSKEALIYVGYLDSRFGRYGHEHVEHTMRMIRAGYGGKHLKTGTRDSSFLLIHGGLQVAEAKSSHEASSVEENGKIFDAIWNEGIHRWPWRHDEDLLEFRKEMQSVRIRPS